MASVVTTSRPWYVGPNGATNVTRYEAQKFARSLLTSETYRQTLESRMKSGTLPPAIEAMLWHYAFGKPIEHVEVTHKVGEDLAALSTDELLKRADELKSRLEEAKAIEEAIPTTVVQGPWTTPQP